MAGGVQTTDPAAARDVPLTVLQDSSHTKRGNRSKPTSSMGKWRAAVLIAVHIAIAVHVVLWLVMGSTVSPVEPSESMQTLELGVVNAGFIFYVLAILSTVVFGRFLCGWGCHVVALQDLCAAMMKRIGVRPKPFRSRLLVYVPLVLGLYMFVWPTFKRLALIPLLEAVGVGAPVWIGVPPDFAGFTTEIIVDDFWATFPPWYVAIPFLGVCGFASVYFLGSKGFCTYGCPYGGIFGAVDQISPAAIVVNDSCEGCGHCTAVCTSNVRVHEEVRDFGMVVDPGCMKCMDCVSACPKDALHFGMASPAILARPKDDAARERQAKIRRNPKRFDLSWPEEIAIAALFVGFFLAFRGMLNLVPMLMAVGMAGVAAFIVWKAWRMVKTPSVRLQSLTLKSAGKIKRAGWAILAGSVVTCIAAAWAGWVGTLRWSAHLTHESIGIPLTVANRPEFDPAPGRVAEIDLAIERFERSDAFDADGIGWNLRPQDRRQLAYLYQLRDRTTEAFAQLDLITRDGVPTDELVAESIGLLRLTGADERSVAEWLDDVLARHPDLHGARLESSLIAAASDRSIAELSSEWDLAIERASDADDSASALLAAAEFFASAGDAGTSVDLIRRAAEADGIDGPSLVSAARLLASLGPREEALALLERAVEVRWRDASGYRAAGVLLATLGERDQAESTFISGIERFPESPGLHEALALLRLTQGDVSGSIEGYTNAAEHASGNAFASAGIGEQAVRAGIGSRQVQVFETGIGIMRSAAEQAGDTAILWHDLGQALLAGGRAEQGLAALRRASELTPENIAIRKSLARAESLTGG
ncbi:MAG: 4Fe-4S dicluster domain-containing protein [Planctomycetota bacterium]